MRRTHTRLRGVDAALNQVSYAPTISCVILARITLYERDLVLDRRHEPTALTVLVCIPQ